jgi:GAF domain-containing protein
MVYFNFVSFSTLGARPPGTALMPVHQTVTQNGFVRRFARDFELTDFRPSEPEEQEIARALATQASLAIHLTRLASQSAVLEEANQLAAEIHDALARSFYAK